MAVFVNIFIAVLLIFNPVVAISGTFYTDNGHQQTVLFKTLGIKEKIELQEELLHLLGLHHSPNNVRLSKRNKSNELRSSAETFLIDVYKTLTDEEDSITANLNKSHRSLFVKSDFIVCFVNKINHQYPHLRHESDRRFYFDTNHISPEEQLVKAEFRIFRNASKISQLNQNNQYFLLLYAVIGDSMHNVNTLELVDELAIGSDSDGWLVFNLTSPVLNWIAFPEKNLGLYLKIKPSVENQEKEHKVSPLDIGILLSKAPEEYKAFMVAYFRTPSNVKVRTTRATTKKQESYYDHNAFSPYSPQKYISKSRSCERWTLYVSFRDLGFEDWIIAPDGYAAFYCDGSCTFPLNAHSNATNHAIVQTLMHLMDPASVPKPSCAPTQLTAITVLYFDDNSDVILKKYRNMVVKSCGCH